MSGALNNIHSTVSLALSLHTQAIVRLQEQAATGSRINRSSDDPSVAYRILGLNSQKRSLANYIDNISGVMDTLNLTSTLINDISSDDGGMVQVMAKIKNTLTAVTSGTYSDDQQVNAATSINEWLEQVVLLANWSNMGQYLFGGTDTDSAPYVVTRTDGEITSVTYQGSNENRQVEVASGVQQNIFQIGDDIFRSDARTDPTFIGDTGAAAGTGTASVTGYSWLNVSDAVNEQQTITITGGPPTPGTTFNIAFGADDVDVAWDAPVTGVGSIQEALEGLSTIGAGNISVAGTSFTSGGITITFTGDLAQTNVAEMVVTDVSLDNGAAPAIATDQEGGMQLSVDGGTAVAIPIGDKTNVAVTSPDGKVLYVDATNITTAGDELVSIAGTHDIFNTLIAIRDVLRNERDIGQVELSSMYNDVLESVDEVDGLLQKASVTIGSRWGFLEGLKNTLDDIKFNSEEEVTNLEQADIAQIAIELSRRELLYQMSLAIAGRLLSMSLLDFIQ